ncbi:uncharacterized protein LOC132253518 [Vitis vinifera]|uniref:uncharacterized protein LOC132253518 n=1 Tax=Vitis vinifera TaxID=29760 RepID=UPI0028830564|nr:uncharacterized protein LOC132253518 [Vitis vinifera]
MEEDIFCYIHEGGEVVKSVDGSVQYKGGWTESIVVSGNITHAELVSKVCGELNIDPNLIKLEFTVKFDPSCLLPLHDETTVVKMFRFNDMFCHVYVFPRIEVVSIQGFALGCRPVIAIDSSHVSGPYRSALFSATAYDANDSMFPLDFGVMSSENYEDWSWFLQNFKKVVAEKEVVIISDRHPALLRSVPEVFGLENHAYCYRHLKENFSTFVSKQITKGNKGKENALQFLDSIAYARLEHDYNVSMYELRKYNDVLATWVEDNSPEHWAMSKFPKQRWDKMTTNLAESFNAWLRHERHHSICNFLMEHMAKLGSMLVKHKEQSNNWKGSPGPQIEEKVLQNIVKGEVYPVTPFMNGIFRLLFSPLATMLLILLMNATNSQMQKLIYAGSFSSIETHDMPIVDDHGVVRSITGQVFLSLKPPHAKRPPGRPRKKRIEFQFQDKQTVHCSRCHMSGHNRKTCKNPLS